MIYAVVMLALLTGCTNKSEKMLQALDEQGVGMLIESNGQLTSYNAPGVEDLLQLTAHEPVLLKGAVVADRRVGKAAASLLITGGVQSVCTPLVSTPARRMLEQAGISVYAREEIPLMVNRDGTDLCPMEKMLMDASTPEECVLLLRGGSLVGKQMLEMLNQQGLSLMVYNDSVLSTHTNRGVQDLLHLLAEQPERLQGAIVADKLIGKAAAAIMATGGVKEVHTNIICTAGRELLEKEGIKVFASEEVPQILNRDRSGQCPFDAQLNDIESIDQCVKLLQDMPAKL